MKAGTVAAKKGPEKPLCLDDFVKIECAGPIMAAADSFTINITVRLVVPSQLVNP